MDDSPPWADMVGGGGKEASMDPFILPAPFCGGTPPLVGSGVKFDIYGMLAGLTHERRLDSDREQPS